MKYQATYSNDNGDGKGVSDSDITAIAVEITGQLLLNAENDNIWPMTITVNCQQKAAHS